MWLRNEWLQRMGGGLGERMAINGLAKIHMVFLGSHKDRDVLQLLRKTRRERMSLMTGFESFLVYSIARSVAARPGDMAEVGVFAGASARLICAARGDKPLHLFDTFEGLPKSSEKDRSVYDNKSKQYACSLESVQEYLREFKNVHYYKGLFPDTAEPILDKTFSFVHLDVDLYESTLACLEFFYPRMVAGGIILSHDYSVLAGVQAAFTEFLADKDEGLLELPTSQCMIVKLAAPTNPAAASENEPAQHAAR